jgi:glycosyltransferase involved in cell wall biosynthesis
MPLTLQVVTSTDRRGAEVFGVDLGAALCARGRETTPVALVPGSGAERMPIETMGETRLGLSTLRTLRALIRQADVVVAHGSSTLPACAVATIGTGVPLVYRSVGDPAFWSNSFVRRSRVTAYLSRTRAVVALTSAAGDALHRAYRVPHRKLHVIPKGVPAAKFPLTDSARRAAARAAFALDGDARAVVYVGALSPEKNVAGAIRAIDPDTTLLIAGDGPNRPELEALATEIAPGRVRFLGTLADPSLLLAAVDALVLPSHTEGLPGVLMEAGLTGLPVVATDVGWVSAIVDDGETGVLVPPRDDTALRVALRHVLDEPLTPGQRSRDRCLRFDVETIAGQWLDLLDTIAPGTRVRA